MKSLVLFQFSTTSRPSWISRRSGSEARRSALNLTTPALTPVKRASEARCRELCALHGHLPFNLMRSAVVVGARYGLSYLGCSAGLMVAMVLIGMSNLVWMIVLSAVVLAYKVAPAPTLPGRLALSAAMAALGVVYAVGA